MPCWSSLLLWSWSRFFKDEDTRNPLDLDPTRQGIQEKGVTAMKKRSGIIGYLVLMMFVAAFVACASTSKQESTGEYVDDSVITTKVKSLLAADDFLKSFQISVETYKGAVQLSGFVNSQKAVDKAGEITRSVQGVKSIKNDLIVK